MAFYSYNLSKNIAENSKIGNKMTLTLLCISITVKVKILDKIPQICELRHVLTFEPFIRFPFCKLFCVQDDPLFKINPLNYILGGSKILAWKPYPHPFHQLSSSRRKIPYSSPYSNRNFGN